MPSMVDMMYGSVKEWPNRTLNQVRKILKRREVQAMIVEDWKTRDVWEVDYLSTSDEEDNDSESEEMEEEPEEERQTM